MAPRYAFIAYLLVHSCFGGQTHVGNKVQGDQTVGGVHLFELHAPGGGIGLGIKVLLIGGLILALLYWYMRRPTIRAIRRTAASAAPAIGTELANVVAQQPQQRSVCNHYCQRRHDDEEPIPSTSRYAPASVRLP